eukprot:m.265138 g.265138  ORF g.265138 m.265138 type:complete len:461 (-) comp60128_c0_seq1:287-1669(-)
MMTIFFVVVAASVLLSNFVVGINDGAADIPPRGWSSWNSFKLNINEDVVRSSADIMAKELLQSGYEYLLIDDGWPPDTAMVGKGPARLPDGTIPVSKVKFPSGFKNLTDYVHSKGLKIGIYTAVSHWTCGGYTGSLGFEDVDAKSFVDWGFDFVKHDTCGGYHGEPADECGVGVLSKGNCIKTSTAKMSAALRKYAAVTSPPKQIVYYIDHGNPTSPQTLYNPNHYFIADNAQSQSDISKQADTPEQLGWTWASDACHMMKTTYDTNDSWESMLNNLHSSINLPEYQKKGYYNMPDMLSVGQGAQSESQYRAQMLLWSIMGAPLILGNDIRNMTPFTLSLITAPEVLAVNSDKDVVQGSMLSMQGSFEIWGKPVSNRVDQADGQFMFANEPAIVLVLFNKGNVIANISVDVDGHDLAPASIRGAYEVRDLLQQKDLGHHLGTLTKQVSPMDAIMLQLVPL